VVKDRNRCYLCRRHTINLYKVVTQIFVISHLIQIHSTFHLFCGWLTEAKICVMRQQKIETSYLKLNSSCKRYLMSNRYKRIHTLAPKYQKWIAGIIEQYIHTKGLLTVQLLMVETPCQSLLYNLKEKRSQNHEMQLLLWWYFCVCVGGEGKRNNVRKDVCVSTSVYLLITNVGIPPQTISATLYLEPEYKSFVFPDQYPILLL